MKGNLFLNSDDQKFNFGLVFFGPPGICTEAWEILLDELQKMKRLEFLLHGTDSII